MARVRTAKERLIKALGDILGPKDISDIKFYNLFAKVRECVREAQDIEQQAEMNLGRKAKMEKPVTWMGEGSRASDALLSALRSGEVQADLNLQGLCICFSQVDGSPIVVRIARTTQ